MTTRTEEKPQRQDKTLLLMQIALELKLYRSPEGTPLAEIPSWDDAVGPLVIKSELMKMWLAYRCFKLHGFVASSTAINAVIRTLCGMAMFDEATEIYTSPTADQADEQLDQTPTADLELSSEATSSAVPAPRSKAFTYVPYTAHKDAFVSSRA